MRCTIIIPTLDEELMLKKQTQQLPPLLAGRGVEVIVSDGGSTDATIDLARHLGKVVSAPRGRSRQMNAGARAAHGDVLLFMHADTTLPPEALDEVRKALGRPGVVGGCFTKAVSRSHWLLTLADLATNLRFRLRLSLYGDRAVFVRRGVFDAVGGYNEALDILEDVDLGLRLKRRGRLVQVPARVQVSDRRFLQGGVARTLLLMATLELVFRLGLDPRSLVRFYKPYR